MAARGYSRFKEAGGLSGYERRWNRRARDLVAHDSVDRAGPPIK